MGDKNVTVTDISIINDHISREAEELKKRDSKPDIDPARILDKELVLIDSVMSEDETEFINNFCRKLLKKEPEQADIDSLSNKLKKNPDQEALIYDYVYSSKKVSPKIEVVGFSRAYFKDLLSFDGMEFVEQCFLLIMQRKADEGARKHFSEVVANGFPKEQLIWELRNSNEGNDVNVEIIGIEGYNNFVKKQRTKSIPSSIKSAVYNLIHIRKIRSDLDGLMGQMGEVIRQNDELRKENERIKTRITQLEENQAKIEQIEETHERIIKLEQELRAGERLNHLENEINRINNCDFNREFHKKLNFLSSALPTIWGDESKINIDPLAAVDTCFFNTNSGNITIGAYTFAGSNVSILAGSHDKNLTGFLRRDAEITEGCDIVIGKGVWLGSNSTILGPATIEDDAVIAAGAVVTPGTHIPKGAIYGGIPAKMISDGILSDEEKLNAVKIAFERNNGILFSEGWTEKRRMMFDGENIEAHFLTGKSGIVYLREGKFNIKYSRSVTEAGKLIVNTGKDEKVFDIADKEGMFELEIKHESVDEVKGWCEVALRLENFEDDFGINIGV